MNFIPSSSQTIGPYFHIYFEAKKVTGCLLSPQANGERIHLACRVRDGQGAPVFDAMIEIWQADAAGHLQSSRRSAP